MADRHEQFRTWSLLAAISPEPSVRAGAEYALALFQDYDALAARLAEAERAYDQIAARYSEQARAESEHCKDCCCARSWEALGISEYTGKSIPEHIADFRSRLAELVGLLRDNPNAYAYDILETWSGVTTSTVDGSE